MNYAVILAAGKGSRMNTNHAKPALKIMGKEIIRYIFDAIPSVFLKRICVVGHKKEEIQAILNDKVTYVFQSEEKGTAHALSMALKHINVDGNTLVLIADIPLIDNAILNELYQYHTRNDNDITLLTGILDNPKGYGRVFRKKGKISEIIEEKYIKNKQINEVYSGVMIVKNHILSFLHNIKENDFNEYYLTDLIKLTSKKYKIGSYTLKDSVKIMGVNDKESISIVSEILRKRIIDEHIKNGVIIPFKNNVIIYPDVVIKKDTYIDEFVSIKGNNYIYEDVKIGPFSHIREGNIINRNVKIGSFVEIKESEIGKNTKIAHHSYIGNTIIGENTIIGAGVKVANFDGYKKNTTIIGDNILIGCNSTLVSPLNIGNNCYIGAHSLIKVDIPSNTYVKPQITIDTLKNRNNSI